MQKKKPNAYQRQAGPHKMENGQQLQVVGIHLPLVA
jgi:hypothetical protein